MGKKGYKKNLLKNRLIFYTYPKKLLRYRNSQLITKLPDTYYFSKYGARIFIQKKVPADVAVFTNLLIVAKHHKELIKYNVGETPLVIRSFFDKK
jgi:hypothetical protein